MNKAVHIMVDGFLAKQCCVCRKWKHLDYFPRAKSGYFGRSTTCTVCQVARTREARRASAARRAAGLADEQRRRREHMRRVKAYLAEHPCVDCGESDPIVLEFDHVRGTKESSIARLITGSTSWQRIAGEIAKCDVRCANCHRRKTARQFGWHAYLQEASK